MNAGVTPFLMFSGQAEQAINRYVALFGDAEVLELDRYGEGQAGPAGSVRLAVVRLRDLRIKAIDSPMKHEFGFTPAISLYVECQSEGDLAHLAAALGEGGAVLMPLGDYGFSRQFTWVNDRFGVSWQLNLA